MKGLKYKIPGADSLKKIGGIGLTLLLLILGVTGLVIAYKNPIQSLESYFDACTDYVLWTGCWFDSTYIYLNQLTISLNNNWIPTLATALTLIAMGLIQPEARSNIKSVPARTVNFYKQIRSARDYIFQKIEMLNSESKKWRTAFNIAKSPFSLLRALGFSPQWAVGILSIGTVATGGVVVNEVTEGRSFNRGDPGVYAAPLDTPTEFSDDDNTLKINLASVPVKAISISNASFNAHVNSTIPSETTALLVSGKPAVAASGDTPAVVATRIEIGTLIFEKVRCKTLLLEDVDAHKIVVTDNHADGLTINMATSTTSRNRATIGGHFQAEEMLTSAGQYDRLVIEAGKSGVNGRIGTLTLSNIVTRDKACELRNLDIGTLRITQNEVGHDENLATKEFVIKDSVTGYKWEVSGNTEGKLKEPDPQ